MKKLFPLIILLSVCLFSCEKKTVLENGLNIETKVKYKYQIKVFASSTSELHVVKTYYSDNIDILPNGVLCFEGICECDNNISKYYINRNYEIKVNS
jgi:hypothetical protein